MWFFGIRVLLFLNNTWEYIQGIYQSEKFSSHGLTLSRIPDINETRKSGTNIPLICVVGSLLCILMILTVFISLSLAHFVSFSLPIDLFVEFGDYSNLKSQLMVSRYFLLYIFQGLLKSEFQNEYLTRKWK